MSERTKLLKKAVLTSVGASTSADRIKQAINVAMDDLVKVGQDLLDDLESKGKIKADSMQNFLKHLQEETTRRTSDLEKSVSKKVTSSMKKAAKDLGLISREDFDQLLERLSSIEETLGKNDGERKSGRKKSG